MIIPVNVLILLIIEFVWIIYVFSLSTNSNKNTWLDLGSDREWGIIGFIFGNLFFIPIWGGIFWW